MGFSVFTLENAILKVIGNTIDSIDATIMEPLRAQVEKTLIYVTPGEGLDAKLIQCKDMVGVDALTFKVIVFLFLAWPFSYVMLKLPSTNLKHLFSGVVGVWMMQTAYYTNWIHSFVVIMATYVMCKTLPNNVMPYVVFLFTMVYLSVSHVFRMHFDFMGYSADYTGPQMVITMKLTQFAFQIYDGRNGNVPVDPKCSAKTKQRLQQQYERSIRTFPTLLEYFGFTFSFLNINAGPSTDFVEYKRVLSGSDGATKGNKYTQSKVLASLLRLFQGIFCVILYQVLLNRYPGSRIYSAENLGRPWYDRFRVCYLCLLVSRMKYYFLWKVAEGSSILAGFGFKGYDSNGNADWSGISNMDITAFETASNPSESARAWNVRTQHWLAECIYFRAGKSVLATYVVSSIWHGFYVGYYMFFISAGLLTEISRIARAKISPRFKAAGPIIWKLYSIACMILNNALINYVVLPFHLLTFESTHMVYSSFGYIPQILVFAFYVIFTLLPNPTEVKGNKKTA